jgi:uncharacterized membrane protein YadS
MRSAFRSIAPMSGAKPLHDDARREPWARRVVFVGAALVCAWPWAMGSMSAIALGAGLVVALAGWSAWPAQSRVLSRWLIQACIVALGLRLDLGQLARAAGDGLLLAIATIFGAMALGLGLGRVLGVTRDLALLISSGTAICGGSAIASVGAAIRARPADMAMGTAVVFTLNAAGVLVLPWIGRSLGMTGEEFGAWAGVAIHDMASVSGVARDYALSGAHEAGDAIDRANVVKLTRVLWILPLTLGAAWWARRRDHAQGKPTPMQWPWFIGLFVLASAVRTLVPGVGEFAGHVKVAAGAGFQVALFLIGSGVSVAALREMGWRAIVLAASVWVVLAGATLGVLLW